MTSESVAFVTRFFPHRSSCKFSDDPVRSLDLFVIIIICRITWYVLSVMVPLLFNLARLGSALFTLLNQPTLDGCYLAFSFPRDLLPLFWSFRCWHFVLPVLLFEPRLYCQPFPGSSRTPLNLSFYGKATKFHSPPASSDHHLYPYPPHGHNPSFFSKLYASMFFSRFQPLL